MSVFLLALLWVFPPHLRLECVCLAPYCPLVSAYGFRLVLPAPSPPPCRLERSSKEKRSLTEGLQALNAELLDELLEAQVQAVRLISSGLKPEE